MRKSLVAAGSMVAALVLGACDGTNWGTIYRETDLNAGRSLVTDAKQRLILTKRANYDRSGRIKPSYVTCAEPSPDVAQALSQSVSAAIQAEVQRAGTSGSGSAEASRAVAASIAQLGERLATIQLLRDALYRACEGYSNGALTSTSYSLILAAYDDLAVTLLSAEIAGGAFGRPLAGISGSALAGTGGGSGAESANENVEKAQEALTAAKTEEKEAADALAELKKPNAEGSEDTKGTAAQISAQEATLKGAKSKTASAQANLEAAQRIAKLAATASLASGGGTVAGIGGLTVKRNDPGSVIKDIHANYLKHDNSAVGVMMSGCMAALDTAPGKPEKIAEMAVATGELQRITRRQHALMVARSRQIERIAGLQNKRKRVGKGDRELLAKIETDLASAKLATEVAQLRVYVAGANAQMTPLAMQCMAILPQMVGAIGAVETIKATRAVDKPLTEEQLGIVAASVLAASKRPKPIRIVRPGKMDYSKHITCLKTYQEDIKKAATDDTKIKSARDKFDQCLTALVPEKS